jgi:hypothetical protein
VCKGPAPYTIQRKHQTKSHRLLTMSGTPSPIGQPTGGMDIACDGLAREMASNYAAQHVEQYLLRSGEGTSTTSCSAHHPVHRR